MAKRTWFTGRQEQLLSLVAKEKHVKKHFYLTGGTALSAVYYNHRVSLDLDLFSRKDLRDQDYLHLLFRTQPHLKWMRVRRQDKLGTNNYVLTFSDGEELNIDFVFYPFKLLGRGPIINNFKIDSKIDIATNKLNTILQRKMLRDYIDLYFLMKRERFTMNQLRKNLVTKFDWNVDPVFINKHILRVSELEDMPKMKVRFSKGKMIDFFEGEARKLSKEIFK